VSAIDQEEIDALEELKATNETITSSLQNDLLLLQNAHKNLTADHELQRNQLVDAFLSKEELSKQLASLKGTMVTTEEDTLGKSQARAIIEDEKTRKVLEEVSRKSATLYKQGSKSPKKSRFSKIISSLSLQDHSSMSKPVEKEPPMGNNEAILLDDDAEDALQCELAAIGYPPPMLISLKTLPLSKSPFQHQFKRQRFTITRNRGAEWAGT